MSSICLWPRHPTAASIDGVREPIEVVLAEFVAAAERVIALKPMSLVQVQTMNTAVVGAPREAAWSRRMRTAESARILGISEHALRRQIRAHLRDDGTALFDGICAERVGSHYRVRLARRWITEPAADGDASDQLAG